MKTIINTHQVTLAFQFSKELFDYIGIDNMVEMNRKNTAEVGDLICHSHDYCDANQAMLDAMEKLNIEYDPNSKYQTDMLNDVWQIAKRYDFFVEIHEIG